VDPIQDLGHLCGVSLRNGGSLLGSRGTLELLEEGSWSICGHHGVGSPILVFLLGAVTKFQTD
jgi:hypothetical protein